MPTGNKEGVFSKLATEGCSDPQPIETVPVDLHLPMHVLN